MRFQWEEEGLESKRREHRLNWANESNEREGIDRYNWIVHSIGSNVVHWIPPRFRTHSPLKREEYLVIEGKESTVVKYGDSSLSTCLCYLPSFCGIVSYCFLCIAHSFKLIKITDQIIYAIAAFNLSLLWIRPLIKQRWSKSIPY